MTLALIKSNKKCPWNYRNEYLSNYDKLEKETERRNKEIQLERKKALTLQPKKWSH